MLAAAGLNVPSGGVGIQLCVHHLVGCLSAEAMVPGPTPAQRTSDPMASCT